MGTLYLVATPIGNLEDISARALRVLGEVSLIAAEDTRHSKKLLNYFNIHTPLTSYFEHNKLSKLDYILSALNSGDVALISDAGTPAINDPGFELVQAALSAGITVSPIPGASAPIAALAASGLPTDSFLYLGYLPRKTSERREKLSQVENSPYTLIFFETPHRLLGALTDLKLVLGDRKMAACREITKLHEEFVRGTISAIEAHFLQHEPRGEFVLVISGKIADTSPLWDEARLLTEIQTALQVGKKSKQVATELAEQSGWNKKEIYALVTAHKS